MITYRRTYDCEGDNNRGWIVHKIDACINNVSIGYLKISYISKARHTKYYKYNLDYMNRLNGWAIGVSANECDYKVTKDILRAACWYMYSDNALNESIKNLTKKTTAYVIY